jgi:hypothetical protein
LEDQPDKRTGNTINDPKQKNITREKFREKRR